MALQFLFVTFFFLFAFVDVWYFVRFAVFIVPTGIWRRLNKVRRLTREEFLATTEVQGMVLPFDLDFQCHMNNSKYLREMDFGRVYHLLFSNFYDTLLACGGKLLTIGASTIRYRRSLRLWERFSLQTRILCWVDNALYVEQRFVSCRDGFISAIALLKMSTKGATVEKTLEKLCVGRCPSPPFPPEVESWAEAIDRSKDNLKRELGLQT